MAHRAHRSGNTGHVFFALALGFAGLGLVGWGTSLSIRSIYSAKAASTAAATSSTNQQRPDGDGDQGEEALRVGPVRVMAAIGWTPDKLAVIGVTPAEFAALLNQVTEGATADQNAIRSQSQAVSNLTKNLRDKERELRLAADDAGRETIRTQIATLREQLAGATSQLTSTKASIRSNYRGLLQSDEQSRLDTIDTKPSMQVPLYYAVVPRTESDWVRLRDALAAQKHAVRKSIELDTTTAEYLATVDADQNVQAAKTRWESNATQLRGMWR